jgi:hypothetical protein
MDTKGDHMAMPRVRLLIVTIASVLAFSAVASSAANAGWMVNGTSFTSGTKALVSTAAVDQAFRLATIDLEVKCAGTTMKTANAAINGTTEMADVASLEFTECDAGGGTCSLGESQFKTVPLLASLALDGSSPSAAQGVFLPKTKGIFATVKFEGAQCPMTGVLPITGSQSFLAPTGRLERTLQLISIKGPLTVLGLEGSLESSILARLASNEPFSFL